MLEITYKELLLLTPIRYVEHNALLANGARKIHCLLRLPISRQ